MKRLVMEQTEGVPLRVHHFFDIIRDLGASVALRPHPYGHAVHTVAEMIRADAHLRVEIVVGCDAVCEGCCHCVDGHCDDVITHRADFASKEAFNDHIDRRIMAVCGLCEGDILTAMALCRRAGPYVENMEDVYEGNDAWHTAERKRNVVVGLNVYAERHGFALDMPPDDVRHRERTER